MLMLDEYYLLQTQFLNLTLTLINYISICQLDLDINKLFINVKVKVHKLCLLILSLSRPGCISMKADHLLKRLTYLNLICLISPHQNEQSYLLLKLYSVTAIESQEITMSGNVRICSVFGTLFWSGLGNT